uniref:Uncharacterized protein n=1 Tax=Anopheles minimus TaxID=112268 RepID=A0A182WFL3_9DIPT
MSHLHDRQASHTKPHSILLEAARTTLEPDLFEPRNCSNCLLGVAWLGDLVDSATEWKGNMKSCTRIQKHKRNSSRLGL